MSQEGAQCIDIKTHSYVTTRIGYIFGIKESNNARIDLTKFDLPKYVKKYYPNIDRHYEGSIPSDSYYINTTLSVKDSLKKYVYPADKVHDVFKSIGLHAAPDFVNLKEDIVKTFVHVLDEDKGYDLSRIYSIPTLMKFQRNLWYGQNVCVKRILTDNNLNPIDIDKMAEFLIEAYDLPEIGF